MSAEQSWLLGLTSLEHAIDLLIRSIAARLALIRGVQRFVSSALGTGSQLTRLSGSCSG